MKSESRYELHARRLHNRARDEYRAWISSLPPEEKAALQKNGLDNLPVDDPEVGGHSPYSVSDLADTSLARLDIDFASCIDTDIDIVCENFDVPKAVAKKILAWHRAGITDAIRKHEGHFLSIIIGGLLSSKNPKLSAVGLAFAFGLDALNGLGSQREYARNNGISPAAVSKVVKAWKRDLNVRANAHQKSDQACETYSKIGKTSHWRKQKVKTGLAARLLAKLKPQSNPINN